MAADVGEEKEKAAASDKGTAAAGASAGEPVDPAAPLAFLRRNRQPKPFFQRPGECSADCLLLPAGGRDDLVDRSALRAIEQADEEGLLSAFPGSRRTGRCGALRDLRAGSAPLPRRRRLIRLHGGARCALGCDAERVATSRCDDEQDAAAVVEVAPHRAEARFGLGGGVEDPLLGQAAGQQGGDDLGCSAAAQRARKRQEVAIRALASGREEDRPYVKFGGLKFLEAAHVKDLLAILRFAENPRDRVSGFRVLQLMPGIGATTAEGILDQLETMAGDASLAEVRVPPRAAEHWAALVQLLELLRRGTAGWPAEIEAARLWHEPHLERRYEDAAVRAGDLVQLVRIAEGFASRMSFLTELTLDPPQATSDLAGAPLQDDDYLTLSTIHSAKGQEWRSVFVLNCVDGCIPSDLATGTPEEIEEERRSSMWR